MTSTSPSPLQDRLVASPCCLPSMPQAELFAACQRLGFRNYEAFSHWAACRHEWTLDPAAVRQTAADYGLTITSYHLPPISDDVEASLANAIAAARFASKLGDDVKVLFKANSRDLFAQVGKRFLDALDEESIAVTPVLQNHKGSAITTLEDYREVLESIDDPRMKCILEVGHFQRIGVDWRTGWDLLGDRIALFHVNDIRDGDSVPIGEGDVDFAGLLSHIKQTGHSGKIVVELELATRKDNAAAQQTLDGLALGIERLNELYAKA